MGGGCTHYLSPELSFSSGAELVETDGLSFLVVLLVRQMRLISFRLPYSIFQYQWSHSKSDALCFDLFNATYFSRSKHDYPNTLTRELLLSSVV